MTSIIFPGQGSQYPGMVKDFYDNFKSAREVFEELEDITSINLKNLLFEDNIKLNLTKYTQISIFTASIVIFKVIEQYSYLNYKDINCMLGHSLGEYSALTSSKKMSLNDAANLIKTRGIIMNDAIEPNISGMAALIGFNSSKIQEIIDTNDLNVFIANDNSHQQIVISGLKSDLNNSEKIFLSNGVKKFVKLNVSAAFHSPLMLDAQNQLNEYINQVNFHESDISIISNFNAKILKSNEDIKNALSNQMANKVKWTESINNLAKTNDLKIIEIGPGKVLSGLIKRINNNFSIISINSISDLKLLEEL